MKKVEVELESLNLLKDFVKEVGNELNVEFESEVIQFQRGILRGRKYKEQHFISTIYFSISNGYQISFIPFSEDCVEIWKINVEERGKGIGSEIMSRILDVSDRTGVKIKLVPVDYDDKITQTNYIQKLKKWYTTGLGFQKSIFPFDPYLTYYPTIKEYKSVG